MNEQEVSARRLVHEAIQLTNRSNSDLEGAVLIGWTCVCEWSDPEGGRRLSRVTGSAGGEDSPPSWQSRGYLYEVLMNWNKFNGT